MCVSVCVCVWEGGGVCVCAGVCVSTTCVSPSGIGQESGMSLGYHTCCKYSTSLLV